MNLTGLESAYPSGAGPFDRPDPGAKLVVQARLADVDLVASRRGPHRRDGGGGRCHAAVSLDVADADHHDSSGFDFHLTLHRDADRAPRSTARLRVAHDPRIRYERADGACLQEEREAQAWRGRPGAAALVSVQRVVLPRRPRPAAEGRAGTLESSVEGRSPEHADARARYAYQGGRTLPVVWTAGSVWCRFSADSSLAQTWRRELSRLFSAAALLYREQQPP